MFFVLLLSLLGYCLLLSRFKEWPIEVLPLFVLSTIILILYISGFVGFLPIMTTVIFIAGIVCLCVFLWDIRTHEKWQCNFSPGFVFFIVASLLIWLKVRYGLFDSYDAFVQWGLSAKQLYFSNSLLHYGIVHYPPIFPLFQYFVCRVLGFSEGNCYLANNILLLAAFTCLFAQVMWRQYLLILLTWLFLYFGVFVFGAWSLNLVSGGSGGFLTMQPDLLMAAFFAAAWIVYFSSKQKILLLVPIIFCLVLLKFFGVFFALLFIAFLFLEKGRLIYPSKKIAISLLKEPLILLGVMIIALITWFYIAPIFNQNSTAALNILPPSAAVESVARLMIRQMFWWSVLHLRVGSAAFPMTLSIIPWTIILLGISFITWRLSENALDRFRLCMASFLMLIGLLAYVAALYYLYVYRMVPEYARYMGSFSRYTGTYFFAWVLLDYYFMMQIFLHRTITMRNVGVLIFFPLLMMLSAPHIAWDFLYGNPKTRILSLRVSLYQVAAELQRTIPPNKKIYVVYQRAPIFLMQILNYEMFPSTVSGTWSFGEPNMRYDIWTQPMAPTEFENSLNDYDYLVLLKTDPYFWQNYGTVLRAHISPQYNMKQYQIYKINKTDVSLKLVPQASAIIKIVNH